MSAKDAIRTDRAPAPAQIFSQGIRRGSVIQVSGQGPVDPATGEYLYPGDVAAQTVLALRNVEAVLTAGGASFDDVVMLRVYLASRDDFGAMNDAYGSFVGQRTAGGALPARTTIIAVLPRPEMLIEVDALAVLA